MTNLIKEAFDREGIKIPYPHAVELSKGEVKTARATNKAAAAAESPLNTLTSSRHHASGIAQH